MLKSINSYPAELSTIKIFGVFPLLIFHSRYKNVLKNPTKMGLYVGIKS